jgi:hypothetical protein
MSPRNPRRSDTAFTIGSIIFIIILLALHILTATVKPVHAHDDEHHEFDAWYQSLTQPDHPGVSCCGVADAYGCDDIFTRDGKNYCRITDDRLLNRRPPLPLGTEIEIPDNKMMQWKATNGNPTGHSIVFLSSGGAVYCFVLGGGI